MKKINKLDLITYFLSENQSGYKTKEKHIIKKFDGLIDLINEFNHKYFNFEMTFTQNLYNYLYDVKNIPKCDNCNKEIIWKNRFSEGYRNNCSNVCKHKSKLRLQKQYETNKIKYGDKYLLRNDEINKKRWETINNKIIDNFNELGYEIIESDKFKLTIKHPDGHIFTDDRRILINRLNGGYEISTKLNPISSTFSTYENELNIFLKEKNISVINNDRKILKGKEIDIYIPDHKLGIEFDGLYWHSDLYLDNIYHLNKTNMCIQQNIQLIHIFEDEWVHKKNIVKSILLSKLNIYDNKLYARKCEIKEINNNKLASEFLEKNHLQGNIGSKFKLGLFYDNELVSLMTFGKKRIALGNKITKDGEYEMLRFCNKLNTQIIGGASRLLKNFIRNYNPNSILTFADRRYSNGNLYEKLGFKFIKNTEPNYWYVFKNEITKHHRFNFRKNILIENGYDKNKTEHTIMLERDIPRIYDCGNLKYEMLTPH